MISRRRTVCTTRDGRGEMEPWSFEMQGRLDEHVLTSEALRGNALGDPHERPLWVYVPPGYDDEPNRRYASVYVIQGLTGQLDMWRNRTPFRRNFPELADAMFAAGDAPPVVVVWVDCWTSLGGSQFLDSPGTGNYLTYLCDEIVPFVDAQLPDDRRPRPPGDPGQVERRLRRDGGADAPPRVCGAGSPRTPATLCSRCATCRSSASRSARFATTTTGRSTTSGRTSAAARRSRRTATTRC